MCITVGSAAFMAVALCPGILAVWGLRKPLLEFDRRVSSRFVPPTALSATDGIVCE